MGFAAALIGAFTAALVGALTAALVGAFTAALVGAFTAVSIGAFSGAIAAGVATDSDVVDAAENSSEAFEDEAAASAVGE